MDVLEGDKPDVLYTAKYNKNCDIGIKYLGTFMMRRQDEFRISCWMVLIVRY